MRHRIFSVPLLIGALLLLLGGIVAAKVIYPQFTSAQATDETPGGSSEPPASGGLEDDIDFFVGQHGANAYIVWQYAGDFLGELGNGSTDQYSFTTNSDICQTLQKLTTSGKYPNARLGVNMHALARDENKGKVASILGRLKNQCGTRIIRIWGTMNVGAADPVGNVANIVQIAKSMDIEVVVAAFDLFQEAPGVKEDRSKLIAWYAGGYRSVYLSHIQKLSNAVGGQVYALELANEPHCAGEPTCLAPYNSWIANVAGSIRGPVGVGQMVQQTPNTGDNPGTGEFQKSNGPGSVSKTSGHYYLSEDRDTIASAADWSKTAGKIFYIGEAAAKVTKKAKPGEYFEHNLQRTDAAGNPTPQSVMNNFLDEYSVACMPMSQYKVGIENEPKCKDTVDGKGCLNWNTTGSLKLSGDGKLFGLFRDENKVFDRLYNTDKYTQKSKFESVESYLSTRAPKTGQTGGSDQQSTAGELFPYQAPMYKLMSSVQQCQVAFDHTRAVEELCKEQNRILGDDTDCLINEQIPGTDMTKIDLYRKIGQLDRCEALMKPKADDIQGQELMNAILSTDFSMEIAYRPAFIAVATKVEGSKVDSNPTFRSQGPDKGDFWQFDYLEVKVPAFGSDFLETGSKKSTTDSNIEERNYKDPLRLTSDLITKLEDQESFRKEEEAEREVLRSNAKTMTLGGTGTIIGEGNLPIKCKIGTGPAVEYGPCEDPMAKVLITFINAHGGFPPTGNEKIIRQVVNPLTPACAVKEDQFYKNVFDPEGKNTTAEEANTIGTNLKTSDKGDLIKKTTAESAFEAETDLDQAGGKGITSPAGQTQLFFISPHNYTLMYAQRAMLGLVPADQQKTYLSSGDFPTVLKTQGVDTFTGGSETHEAWADPGAPTPPPVPGQTGPPKPPTVNVLAKLMRTEKNGQEEKSPLLWQVAGSIANMPTRLMSFVTVSKESPIYQYTLGCKGPFATEDWFLGRCTPAESTGGDGTGPGGAPAGGEYCIAWELSKPLKGQTVDRSALITKLRASLMSYGYTLENTRKNETAVAEGSPFKDWTGKFIPADKVNFFENFYGGGRALLWTQSSQCNGQACFDYIIDVCSAKGFNPALCVAMNLSESGGSNHVRFPGSYDFGCLLAEKNNVASGLECITSKFFQNQVGKDYNAMFRVFAEQGTASSSYRKIEDWYKMLVGDIGYVKSSCQ